MSKEKTGDNKPHPRMDMQAMLDRQEYERNQAKKHKQNLQNQEEICRQC